jgi:hypothetical protein
VKREHNGSKRRGSSENARGGADVGHQSLSTKAQPKIRKSEIRSPKEYRNPKSIWGPMIEETRRDLDIENWELKNGYW